MKDRTFERKMLYRSVFNPRMLGVLLVSIGILYFEYLYNEFMGKSLVRFFTSGRKISTDAQSCILNVYAASIYILVAGMIPGVAYAFSTLEEKRDGFLRYELSRMSPKRYIRSKIFCVAVSGGISTLVPYLAVAIPSVMVGAKTTPENCTQVLKELTWGKIMFLWDGYLVLILKGILLLLFGIFWAELSFLLSLFIRSRYVAYCAPYLLYEALHLLSSIIDFDFRWIFIPIHMIRYDMPAENHPLWAPYVIFLAYTLICIVMICAVFKRQVAKGE